MASSDCLNLLERALQEAQFLFPFQADHRPVGKSPTLMPSDLNGSTCFEPLSCCARAVWQAGQGGLAHLCWHLKYAWGSASSQQGLKQLHAGETAEQAPKQSSQRHGGRRFQGAEAELKCPGVPAKVVVPGEDGHSALCLQCRQMSHVCPPLSIDSTLY